MYKLIATYKIPEDAEAFNKHYEEVHTPLVKKVPGVKEIRMNRVFAAPMGKPTLHLVAEVVFSDKETFNNAMKSPENMACGKDVMGFAGSLVSVHFAQEEVITP
tara:strand:- start:111 stop:422 length:312 start_codon:yes stop_codon:yes gene_type:complete